MTIAEHSSLRRIRAEEHSTLAELSQELIRQQATKVDYIVDTRRMSFNTYTPGDSEVRQSFLTFDGGGHDDVAGGPLNQHAHTQLRTRIGIPSKYYERMRADAPELLDRNVLHWLHSEPEPRMVRMLDGKVRAFLSNRYRRLDNVDLMEQAIMPTLGEFGGRLVFHIAALTDEKLYLRAILPDLAADIQDRPGDHTFLNPGDLRPGGDIVQAGVEIKNSEVGSGALSCTPFIWRLRCFNGLVISDRSLSRYHVGRAQEEDAYAIYADDTLKADDAAFFLKVRDAVKAALSDTQFAAIVDQLREAAGSTRIADPVAATEKLGKTFDLNETESGSVLRYLAEGGDLTKWGAVNAVTRAAKDADDFARQAELEALGGVLVAMPEAEWVRVASTR